MATTVAGLEKLQRQLRAMSTETRSAIRQAIAQGADDMVGLAQRLAPKKTGALAKSIVATPGGKSPAYSTFRSAIEGDPDLTVVISAGNSKVRYAHLVEFGTAPHINKGLFPGTQNPGTDAQPFFFPAYRATRRSVRSRIARAVTRAAKKAAAKS